MKNDIALNILLCNVTASKPVLLPAGYQVRQARSCVHVKDLIPLNINVDNSVKFCFCKNKTYLWILNSRGICFRHSFGDYKKQKQKRIHGFIMTICSIQVNVFYIHYIFLLYLYTRGKEESWLPTLLVILLILQWYIYTNKWYNTYIDLKNGCMFVE